MPMNGLSREIALATSAAGAITMEPPLLSVFIWSFNNADSIASCLEGVVSQRCGFPFEVIVHDDASQDGTREIVRDFEKRFPALFRNVLHERNRYSQGKDINQACAVLPRGRYVALLHGDDWWTDERKLEKQVAFLEKTEASACGHRVEVLGGERRFEDLYHDWKDRRVIWLNESFTIKSPFATSSLVFRREILQKVLVPLPRWLRGAPFADRPFVHFAAAENGVGWLEDEMAVYRVHEGGTSRRMARASTLEASCLLYQRLYRCLPGIELNALAPLWQNFFGGLMNATADEAPYRFKLRLARLLWCYPEFWEMAKQRYEAKTWKKKRSKKAGERRAPR